jgi:RND family efflux transporter MFP subunit
MQDELFVVQKDEDIIAPSHEVEEKFKTYFGESGVRGFFAAPLADDLGRIGTLSFESSDPEFLNAAHFEMIRVLAGQVTVALRNAEMYKEVPFIGILEPILKEKQKFLRLEKGRRMSRIAIAAAVAIFLVAVPLPMRVDGVAAVLPVHMAQIQPEVEGVVRQVFVREGQRVNKGDVLADLEDWNYRTALDQAQARYQTALAEANRALAANDGGTAGVQRAQADFWGAEVQRDRERLEHTHLRSPIEGTVATPHVEDFAGKHLAAGDMLAQVVDSSAVTVDVALDEDDIPLAKAGASASVKLDGFPARTFRGKVTVVSPQSEAQGDSRVFFARVAVANPQNLIRAGMQGRGKVFAGWHPAGFVLLRGPALWLWAKFWSWFGF